MATHFAGTPLPTLIGTHSPSTGEYMHLPQGRWSCGETDAEQAFVPASDQRRTKLWSDWKEHLGLVRSGTGQVAACWLSGSFFTSKAVPGDIDCVYVIRRDLLLSATTDAARVMYLDTAFGGRDVHGLEVDAYPLHWQPYTGTTPAEDPANHESSEKYLRNRGYWDDFWSRMRSPSPDIGMMPRRGYLEVVIDGYQ